jgi:hypothetical protein
MIAASNGWILAYDNLSKLADWQSDALCRVSTGSGFGTRKLHSDDEEMLFEAARPIIFNGIESLAERPDLADRTITIELPVIAKDRRQPESELWAEYNAKRPEILGGLCDAVAAALHNYKQVSLGESPRMADFAIWCVAAESDLGCKKDEFMRAYGSNRKDVVESTIEADPVARAIRYAMADRKEPWEGNSTELLDLLLKLVDGDNRPLINEQARKSESWASSARALSGRVTRAAAFLRAGGIDVVRQAKGRRITLRPVPQEEAGNFA